MNPAALHKDFISQLRKAALHSFQIIGFPTTKNEDWKYTNVIPLVKNGFEPVGAKTQLKETPHFDNIVRLKANRLVFIDGFFDASHSEIVDNNDKVIISPLGTHLENAGSAFFGTMADYNKDGFTAMNTSFFTDGAFIHIPKNCIIENPILLYFISTEGAAGNVSVPRNLVIIGENAQCSLVECHQNLSSVTAASNSVTEIALQENAGLEYSKILSRTEKYSHIGTTAIRQEKNSRLNSWSVTCGGNLVRNNLNVMFNDENCETQLFGLYVLSGNDHADNHVTVDHAKPRCRSNQLYKGIINGAATGVFCGRILVRKDAQKTNAFQANKNILLSEQATVHSKPQLEIFADDVKCTHGATTGQLDEEAVFYMRSRGISEQHAKNILHQAFAWEVIDKISNNELKDYLAYSLMIALNR
ncbi:MAG TPA: Fe-S cluster assembly protein SufD [Chitinophagales bacterium]|nr:Fe-S cluster assembly protein SufD [Chitinophagales bacterium]